MKPITPILLAFMMILIIGCGLEPRPAGDVNYFLLDVPRPPAEAAVKTASCLRIRPCRMAAAFAGRSLIYRTGAVLYEQDYYNLFLTSPDGQITDILQGWFRETGFGDCVSDDARAEQYTLDARIDVFCADFTDTQNPVATVQMHVFVTTFDNETAVRSVVLEKTFSVETPLPESPTAAKVVEGLSSSLSKILQTLEGNLVNAG